MKILDTKLDIRTLGQFLISVDGKPMATNWPGEPAKLLFCSLLSPLDLCFTWDRICRSVLGVPATRLSRLRLEEDVIRPLNSFLIKELGFQPIITGVEDIRIDQQCINLDALEFHESFLVGLKLLSLGNHAAALDNFSRANDLYAGSYLPGMPGIIIGNTRKDLGAIYGANCIQGRNAALEVFRMFNGPDGSPMVLEK